jgi:anti-sigma B factor antagonist
MELTPFQAHVRYLTDATASILDLSGDIDGHAEQALNQAFEEAGAANLGKLVLNFADVTYINSTGIALVVGLLMRARRDHRTLSAWGLSDHFREIFEITRLAEYMPIYADEVAALRGAPAAA